MMSLTRVEKRYVVAQHYIEFPPYIFNKCQNLKNINSNKVQ